MTDDRVTLRDVYEAIGSLESKIDEKIKDNAARIDTLETFRDRWLGAMAVISLFGGAVSSWLWERLFK